MSRFNFLTALPGATTTTTPAVIDDPYDDRTPLSPNLAAHPALRADRDDDLEAQHPPSTANEMRERSTPTARFLSRFRPPIPSFFSSATRPELRPSSSHYSSSGQGLSGPPGTVIDDNGMIGSPKSVDFRIREQQLPSTRLHLPELGRAWSRGENGPPTRPGTGDGVAEPQPVVVREGRGSRSRSGSGSSGDSRRERRRRHRRDGSGDGSGRSGRSHRSHRSHGSSEEGGRSARRDRERRRRRHGERGSRERRSRPPPKNFLFCFPWIKSRRIRSQVLQCFVSGIFLAMMLTVYLVLSLTKNLSSREFTILMIVINLAVAIFFCHGLIRLCMLVHKARKREAAQAPLPEMSSSGGYAIPEEPIPVVLARDEEAAGVESEATKTGPPAYGVWRESVRVDPDRLYWMRNEHAAVSVDQASDTVSSVSSGSGSGSYTGGFRTNVHRPPSYSSDDGVSYVVDARPRSTVPGSHATSTAGSHPSEAGRGPWI